MDFYYLCVFTHYCTSGVGKTHIGSAIGYSLVEKGKRVKFLTAIAAVQQLHTRNKT